MRLVYLGTPADAVPPLRALVDAGHEIVLVVTQPDRRRGRGAAEQPSPVKAAATELGLRVVTPARARDVVDEVAATGAELGVVVAFGQLLPQSLLDALPHGFVNVHFSLLPRWRGAAPVERAILAGDAGTGVGLMRIVAALDAGPVFATRRVAIRPDDTAGDLHARLVDAAVELLRDELNTVVTREPVEQQGEPTYAEKLTVDEFRLDPHRPAVELDRIVRAGNPKPGAWCTVGGTRVKVHRAHVVDGAPNRRVGAISTSAELQTAAGALALDEVQPEGKARMAAADWRRGLSGDVAIDPVPESA
ncbi:MAG TPA: methionyl-tRNA formyltransferase [Acidimicrobiia bacterium]|nr:methionyl-tRNA formyltransferase [Acidimicrobiia bacterium]